MNTNERHPESALLVVDVQRGVMDESWQPEPVIARIGDLVERARSAGTPVVWVQHSDEGLPRGSAEWEIVDDLVPGDDEIRVHKTYGDSFEGTDLQERLAELGTTRLIVVGAETDACIRSTIHGAFTRGYDTVLVSDAHTAGDKTAWGAPSVPDVIAHTNLYWGFQAGPGKTAAVVPAAEVDFTA